MLERIGSNYGGWNIPTNILNKDSICYCIGVGEDASFDLGLIEKYECEIYAYDPTPKSIKYIDGLNKNNKYIFKPIGLWIKDTTIKFHLPLNENHVSSSIGNLQNNNNTFDAEVQSLTTMMSDNNHSHIDLLKIDIEGAEYEVLDDILKNDIDIKLICVEYHHNKNTRKSIQNLSTKYDLIHRYNNDYVFIKK